MQYSGPFDGKKSTKNTRNHKIEKIQRISGKNAFVSNS